MNQRQLAEHLANTFVFGAILSDSDELCAAVLINHAKLLGKILAKKVEEKGSLNDVTVGEIVDEVRRGIMD